MAFLRLVFPSLALFLPLACTVELRGVVPPTRPGAIAAFGAYPGLDDGAVARRLASRAFRPLPHKLIARPDGSLALWYDQTIVELASDGQTIRELDITCADASLVPGTIVRRAPDTVVAHPNGDYTLVRPNPSVPGTKRELARLAKDGTTLATTPLVEPLPPLVPPFYRVGEDGAAVETDFATDVRIAADVGIAAELGVASQSVASQSVAYPSNIATDSADSQDTRTAAADERSRILGAFVGYSSWVADRGDGYFALARYARRSALLVHMTRDGEVDATTWLFPSHELPVRDWVDYVDESGKATQVPIPYAMDPPVLTVDGDGHLWVASAAPAQASALLSKHLGVRLVLGDTADLFVLRFTPELVLERAVVVPGAHRQFLPVVAVDGNGVVGVAAHSATPLDGEPTRSTQYELFFGSVSPARDTGTGTVMPLPRDTSVHDITSCGEGFCLAGETDTMWVDTGSQVAFGKGFVMKVSAAGEQRRLWTLHGPRHNVVWNVAATRQGIYFGATTNGPITHTDDVDPKLGFGELVFGRIKDG